MSPRFGSRCEPANDHEYGRGLANHPEGFVANFTAAGIPSEVLLHRASCKTILPGQRPDYLPGAFPERRYRKACAGELRDLVDWSARRGWSAVTREFGLCMSS